MNAVSIHAKLIGFAAVLIAAIVGFLTWHFSSQQIDTLAAEQQSRAEIYGDLFANELRSAVAFADHATAGEVLEPLAADRDVAGIVLYGSDGAVLYRAGTPSAWVEQAKRGVVDRRVLHVHGRVAVVSPVAALEGPRGTLVIELDTARIHADQARVTRTAIGVGIAVLAFGTLVAWSIARSLVRRLRAIGTVATAVTSGSGPDAMVEVDSRDEIGVLAVAFNTMLVELRDTQRSLEERVDHRTTELRTANVRLQGDMERLTAMEIELRQAQKLESVGRLAAGIAHEINTPVQFASDSCAFLAEASKELIAVIASGQKTPDTDYLLEEVPSAVERALVGLERVAAIVRAMKEFAYADQPDQSAVDLNRAIQSTLVVARNEYKYVAEVHTELADLPLVTCHVGELNQVVLNIVVNAAHAIEATGRAPALGNITIRTSTDGDAVVIEIADDGCGIPQEHIDKIYDPFFTTKEIGKGTGQGLAIARAVVVDKHHGRLDVASTPGGTTFTIRIPIDGIAPLAQAA